MSEIYHIGVRVPLIIVSPFTRGGKVFTEHADHASQILFLGRCQLDCILTIAKMIARGISYSKGVQEHHDQPDIRLAAESHVEFTQRV